MREIIKEWIKFIYLSNQFNWEMYSERGWSIDVDGNSKPRKFYRHKKYPYFITNVFVKKPLHITDLINRFMLDYKKRELLLDETFYIVSE